MDHVLAQVTHNAYDVALAILNLVQIGLLGWLAQRRSQADRERRMMRCPECLRVERQIQKRQRESLYDDRGPVE